LPPIQDIKLSIAATSPDQSEAGRYRPVMGCGGGTGNQVMKLMDDCIRYGVFDRVSFAAAPPRQAVQQCHFVHIRLLSPVSGQKAACGGGRRPPLTDGRFQFLTHLMAHSLTLDGFLKGFEIVFPPSFFCRLRL